MVNLCAPLPVTVPPAPAPAPSWLFAGPLPGGRASKLPSQWGVGKREGGRRREEGGWEKKGGDPVVFHGGEGSSSQLSPSLYRQAHFPGTQATFLHLAQAETIASNWDSQQRHGPSGILSFSFSFSSFLPPSFSFSLSPSSFLPPFIGVYLQSLQ